MLMAVDGSAGWRVAGHIGGPISAIAVDATVLYAGVGFRLHVYDVSNPAAPREIGSTEAFGDFITGIAVANSRVYVAAGKDGLHIVDVADPANPRLVGRWDSPGSAEGVAVAGTRVFLADGPLGLQIVDVSNPAAPVLLSSLFDTFFAFDVAVSGGHAFVAAAGAGLLVADVGDAGNPRAMTTVDTPGYARRLAVSGSTLYLADQWGGVRIVDITNPAAAREIAAIPLQSWAFDVVLSGSILHVAAGSEGFRAFDITDPRHPRQLSGYDIPWNLSWRIAVSGNRAFLGVRTQGITIFDVGDPSAPRRLGAVSPLSNAQAVAARGALAFVATESQGMRVVDFAETSRPRERGRGNTNDYGWAIVADERRAYTCEGYVPAVTLRLFDVENPEQPIPLASPRIGGCRDLMLKGASLYVPDEFGLQIWDVANPAAPVLNGTFHFPGSGVDQTAGVESVDVAGTIAYVDTEFGAAAIDVSDPRTPRLTGTWSSQFLRFDLCVEAPFVYVISGIPLPELVVLDATDPARLKQVGVAALPGPGQRVIVRGGKAFVAVGAAGVAIIDVSNPGAPVPVTRIPLPAFAKELTFAGGRLLVAASDGGLFVLEETSTPSPVSMDAIAPERWAYAPAPHPAVRVPTSPPRAAMGHRPAPTLAGSATARTIVVKSAADSGAGTLREALTSEQAGDTITFDATAFPPNAPVTIRPQSRLPSLQHDGITLDASNAGVVLDGSALSGAFEAGIEIASKGNRVKGLQIVSFPFAGIYIHGNGGNVIGGDRSQGAGPSGEGNVISLNKSAGINVVNPNGNRFVGNLIGTDVTGRQGLGGQNIGVNLFYIPGNGDETGPDQVGGSEPWEANVISGNDGAEVYLHNARGHSVIGNYLGTDPTGSLRVGSCLVGVATSVAAGNVIRGNVMTGEQFGIFLIDTGSHSNLVVNNWIGVTQGGNALTTNAYASGVAVFESFNAVVGNTTRGNITMNNQRGNVAETIVIGNTIGRSALPENPPGQQAGIRLDSAWRSFIGGLTPEERNEISGNTLGVWVRTPGIDRSFILGNSIHDTVIGVDLGSAESSHLQANVITGNQHGVTVAGPTNRLRRNSIYGNRDGAISIDATASGVPPPPIIAEVTLTSVRGTACERCSVEIFSDNAAQGRWYEGTTSADAAGVFSFTTPASISGSFVTATATDGAGSTSMLSAAAPMPPRPPRRRAARH